MGLNTMERDLSVALYCSVVNSQQVSKILTQTICKQCQPCYRCGKANHCPLKCHFIGATCKTSVETLGISWRYVRNSGKSSKATATRFPAQITFLHSSKLTTTRAHYVETEEVSNSDKLYLFAIGTSS